MGEIDVRRQVIQLVLFEEEDPRNTKMVALYDLAPRFVFDSGTDGGDQRKVIEREFSFCSKRYKITIKPTVTRASDGTETFRYPGEREQIVEEVIRRLAAERNRLNLHEGKVRFPFTLYEVREELRRVRHSYNTNEIKDAITTLNECPIRIESLDDGKRLLSASAFPTMAMRSRSETDEDAETFVEFNPMVADAIRRLSFRQVSYELLMEIRDPVARWLYKRLHQQIAHDERPVQEMLATEIWRDSGMSQWKKTRSMLQRVKRSVEILKERGLLDQVECEERKNGKKKEDVLFVMFASQGMLREVERANKRMRDNIADFERLSGNATPDRFEMTDTGALYSLRSARKRRFLEKVSDVR